MTPRYPPISRWRRASATTAVSIWARYEASYGNGNSLADYVPASKPVNHHPNVCFRVALFLLPAEGTSDDTTGIKPVTM